MNRDLSELLRDATSDGPPLRYTAADVLTAGRRQQKRRRSLWVGAGSAVVAAAVAAVAVAPQLLPLTSQRGGDGGFTTVTAPAAERGKGRGVKTAQGHFAYPRQAFAGNFGGWVAGDLTIQGASLVTSGYQVADILAPGRGQEYRDDGDRVYFAPNVVGHVITYARGVFNPAQVVEESKVDVGGTPGYFRPGRTNEAPGGAGVSSYDEAVLTWKYDDDAWAQVVTNGAFQYTAQQLTAVAEGLTSGTETPMRIGMKLGYVPDGYRLAGAGTTSDYLEPTFPGQSYLRLVKGAVDYSDLTTTAGDGLAQHQQQRDSIRLSVFPAWMHKYPSTSTTAYCPSDALCYRYTADRQHVVELTGGGSLPDADMLKVLNTLTLADPDDPSTWFGLSAGNG